MIDKHLLTYLRYAHGLYNILVAGLLCYHGWTGFSIKKQRQRGEPRYFSIVRRHRKMGPILAVMGVLGFFSGLAVALLDKGLLEYPLHLSAGLAIVVSLVTTYAISRKIVSPDSPMRRLHLAIGFFILCVYFVQLFLGLGILL
ncbi:MAG: DUF4079 domain-containing protein [Nitrospirota bacterium]|nr:DUF4079 domain-containing protein [Nitrospirota bacterium]